MTDPLPTPTIIPLNSPLASLQVAGGKGANLARLLQAGLPVPCGFIVTAAAYQDFVAAEQLNQRIQTILAGPALDDPAALEAASVSIRARFDPARISPPLADQILQAYRSLQSPPVAVRSSATAEDLPGFSFAGQQDTFLNVSGEQALLSAVASCWSSLWTARAIAYRAHNGLSQTDHSLAVVVQAMVASEVSGVLFTANPLSGRRSETVIDATFGLGEALVSGQVEPDHYVVDRANQRIKEKTVGAKALSIVAKPGGGVEHIRPADSLEPALTDDQILALVRLGAHAEALYAFPQDIEWALAGGDFYLLQSRSITTLYPLVEGFPADPPDIFFSFGAVQGLLDPITPLGQDMLRMAFAGFARLANYHDDYDTQRVLYEAGERMWGRITPLMRNTFGRRLALGALVLVEPAVQQVLVSLSDEPGFQPKRPGIRLATAMRVAYLGIPVGTHVARNLLAPDRRREWIINMGERALADMQASIRTSENGEASLTSLLDALSGIPALFKKLFPPFISAIAGGMIGLNILNLLSKHLATGKDPAPLAQRALEITRGMPYNVTTQMDLQLWETARKILASPATSRSIRDSEPAVLSKAYLSGQLPEPAQSAVVSFLESYGVRGIGEIDIGRPRWREDPTPLFQVLQSYLQIDEHRSPSVVFDQSEQAAHRAVESLVADLRQTRGGWFKARLARWAARRVRSLLGLRENPKFTIIRLTGLIRQGILEVGQAFTRAGIIARPDDLFFLTYAELRQLSEPDGAAARDWQALINEHRSSYEREMKRRQVPRLILSDGRTFYEGMANNDEAASGLLGSPVSAGVAEGRVRVVLDPRGTQLEPGEILVCPGTDPAWTPLFLAAGGLVMEVGGMMTHGAVVAREYGIPAVVGVHQATQVLKTGQRIRMDGSSGRIDLLGEPAP